MTSLFSLTRCGSETLVTPALLVDDDDDETVGGVELFALACTLLCDVGRRWLLQTGCSVRAATMCSVLIELDVSARVGERAHAMRNVSFVGASGV